MQPLEVDEAKYLVIVGHDRLGEGMEQPDDLIAVAQAARASSPVTHGWPTMASPSGNPERVALPERKWSIQTEVSTRITPPRPDVEEPE